MKQSPTQLSKLLSRSGFPGRHRSQSGIILVITLFCLVIMLVSAIALIRSSDASIILLGNLGFRRDLVNQGEIGIQKAYAEFNSGGSLAATATRLSNLATANYSVCVLPSDSRGIPLLLEDEQNFATPPASDLNANTASCGGNVALPANDVTNLLGVNVRYLIDRLCIDNQVASATNCISDSLGHDQGGSDKEKKPGSGTSAIYRISVRIKGPHNTATYIQSTITL